ncbi:MULTISPECIES: glycosyltransferase family 2 protein [Halolamina]|uniref:Glycosyl transferase family 2 n=1 Tax=Halolamina pelagica TaxID=699431 RepID=A0A1I5S8Z7_9EURY|nr:MULTISPECIES: glycosyltransferase [Halolamina]NHX37173.1 glycosyltransferase [Halolamina sp. R1-12]SFP67159.1 Glycosyl transferase family 2 [Halolamina pelagica]
MDLSVVVPTLNGRDRLAASLDSLASRAPGAEVVVVNGPSADGTTGMVRERTDVDVLVEVADRCINVARNAGIAASSGDAIALLGFDLTIAEGWVDAIRDGLAAASAVTGPVSHGDDGENGGGDLERRRIAGRDVRYFNGDNVAFRTATLRETLDGFDEYLRTGGARDAAHRLAGAGYQVAWRDGMTTNREADEHDGPGPHGPDEQHRNWKYRSLSYRLTKNYGPRPTVARRTLAHATGDAADAARAVLRGEGSPSAWFGNGREVISGILRGSADGLVARARDRSETRNPYGLAVEKQRAVATYDRRE